MAIKPNTGLETHPAGTSNPGGIINGNWERIDQLFDPALASGDAGYQSFLKALIRSGTLPTTAARLEWDPTNSKPTMRAGVAALTYGASVALDFAGAINQTLTLTGNVTFTTSNRAAGRDMVVIITADASSRNLTFPAGWVWASTKPTAIAASKTGKLKLTSTSTTDALIVAEWTVAP